ncbi:MAG: hypothetical protein RQ899_07870 [Pseudomonadales bacterium]|nr:hypothetical protein [Pseudomonadales bacterium]
MMTRIKKPWFGELLIPLAWFFSGLPLQAQEPSVADGETLSGRLPEEITVTGQASVRNLRNRVDVAEDRMYALFNELNDDDLYDFHCIREARIGTRLQQKVCRPRYMDEVGSEDSYAFLQGRQFVNANSRASYYNNLLQEKFKSLMLESPEFYRQVLELDALNQALAERQRSRPDDDEND